MNLDNPSFHATWSSHNPFRPLVDSRNAGGHPYASNDAYHAGAPTTPVYPPPRTPVQPVPYVPGPPHRYHTPSVDSLHSEDNGGAGGLYPSVSNYVAAAGAYVKPFNLSPGTWKDEDKLSLTRGNYATWSKRVYANIGLQSGATRWLDLGATPPSFLMYPQPYRIWHDNDVALRSYLELTCDSSEHQAIEKCGSAAAVWATLRTRHTQRGPIHQVATLRETMAVQFSDDPNTWAKTCEAIRNKVKAVFAGQPPSEEGIHTVVLLHALAPFSHFVDSLLVAPDLSPAYIETALASKAGLPRASLAVNAVDARHHGAGSKPRACSNPQCKSPAGHTFPYCVAPGGGMAGKSVIEARAKHRTDADGKSGTSKGGVAVNKDKQGYACVTIGGTDYRLASGGGTAASTSPAPAVNVAHSTLRTDDPSGAMYDLETFHVEEVLEASVDWADFTANAADAPRCYELYSDTGATCTITPFREDFVSFRSIEPRPVAGFQGSSIDAIGVGTIVNSKLVIHNALYVPKASIRLLSVSRLCQSNAYACHFDGNGTWITDQNNTTICKGNLTPRGLYKLDCALPLSSSAYEHTAAVTIDTMHRRLGHAHHQAVVDLHQHQMVDGRVVNSEAAGGSEV